MDEAAGSVIFRPYKDEDLPFLMDSWGSSYFKGVRSHKKLSSEEFHSFHRPLRERFFSKPNTCVIVACSAADEWFIVGWIAVESIPSGLILHYLYVRATGKKENIAAELIARGLPNRPVFYTHLTEVAAKILAQHQHSPKLSQFFHLPHLV